MNSILRAKSIATQVADATRKAADDLIKAVEKQPLDEAGILQAHSELKAATTLLGSHLGRIKRHAAPQSRKRAAVSA